MWTQYCLVKPSISSVRCRHIRPTRSLVTPTYSVPLRLPASPYTPGCFTVDHGLGPAFAGMTKRERTPVSQPGHEPPENGRPLLSLRHPRPSLPTGLAALIFSTMQTVITVLLNGETRALDGPVSVSGLLATLGLEGRKVAVERNESIVPRSRYAETWLASGDALEIVHFIGGG